MLQKKTGYLIYIVIVVALCLAPFALMSVRPTTTTTENKPMAKWPSLWDEKGFNRDFLEEAGEWFDDHFAFRQELVSADAKLRGSVFGTSATDSVIYGKDGWLYYEATLDDFQHKNSVSDRALFNMAHNTALMQEYTESLGKTFLFTIAPNKNSLYGENMPERYQYTVAQQSDAERLIPWLEKEGVNYIDLFSLFEKQDEVLYYARDSHWNQKGAVLVYNTLLDACGKEHETYENVDSQIRCDYYGDLNLMLYPVGSEPEDDVHYQKPFTYVYQTEGATVEDQFVQTTCENGTQNLLMYRDSFGNSLLPYFAENFANASFSKQVPYPMTDLVTTEADIVIVEKVERHLPTLSEVPPLMSGIRRQLDSEIESAESNTTFRMKKEGIYYKMQGIADEAYLDPESRIYIEVTDGENTGIYEAFCVNSVENGTSSDYGFLLYLSQLNVSGDRLGIRVIGQQGDRYTVLYEGEEKLQQ